MVQFGARAAPVDVAGVDDAEVVSRAVPAAHAACRGDRGVAHEADRAAVEVEAVDEIGLHRRQHLPGVAEVHRQRQVDLLVNQGVPLDIGLGDRIFEDLDVAQRRQLPDEGDRLLGGVEALVGDRRSP